MDLAQEIDSTAALAVPYVRWLGVESIDNTADGVRVHLPYQDGNSNLGGTLHGGVFASLIAITARLTAVRAMRGAQESHVQTLSQTVQYLSTASKEAVWAQGRVLRTGKRLCFVEVSVNRADGEMITHGSLLLRVSEEAAARSLNPPTVELPPISTGEILPVAQMLTKLGFIARLGLGIERMVDGQARINLPYRPELDDSSGHHHDGAVAGLFDTTGAMAAFALKSGQGMRAVTPSLHINILDGSQGQNLSALGKAIWQRDEMYLSEVTVVAADGRICARGSMAYRVT